MDRGERFDAHSRSNAGRTRGEGGADTSQSRVELGIELGAGGVLVQCPRLMYGGHEVLGWQFVEASWKPGFPSGGDSSKEDTIGYY